MNHATRIKIVSQALKGETVVISSPDKQSAKRELRSFVRDLKPSELWSAYQVPGYDTIKFSSGGEIRFASRPEYLDGVRADQVITDEQA